MAAEIRFRKAETNVKKVSLRERRVKDAGRGSGIRLKEDPPRGQGNQSCIFFKRIPADFIPGFQVPLFSVARWQLQLITQQSLVWKEWQGKGLRTRLEGEDERRRASREQVDALQMSVPISTRLVSNKGQKRRRSC